MARFLIYISAAVMMISGCTMNNGKRQEINLNDQMIGMTSAHNARQLGGYRIGEKKIKADLLLRSAHLAKLSNEDSAMLSDRFRLQKIYDFRGADETTSSPDVIPGDAAYLSLSVALASGKHEGGFEVKNEQDLIGLLLKYADSPEIQEFCTSLYDMILFDPTSQEVYRQFFADLVAVNPQDGAVIWHCTQGKDRAGCASALLLAALGADRDLIMEDFTLSKAYYDQITSHLELKTEAQKRVIGTLISANPELFENALDKIDEKYGSITSYLTECLGVTQEMMETLRERYLE